MYQWSLITKLNAQYDNHLENSFSIFGLDTLSKSCKEKPCKGSYIRGFQVVWLSGTGE